MCAGGGLHFVADADIVIASDDASFLDPHVSIGQVTAYEAIALVRKSPMEPIVRMALTGRHERITAERACQLGIVSQVVPAGELEGEAAQAWPRPWPPTRPRPWPSASGPCGGALELGLTDACRAGAVDLVAMWGHPDQAEATAAFTDRRPAASWQPLSADVRARPR